MPLFVFRKLGLGDLNPTTVSLQLAYRSIKYLIGVIKDVLVKVDKFHFPADFIVLDWRKIAQHTSHLRPIFPSHRKSLD